ncbi:hypothetical protein GCM10020295_07700 [Streptomyces cinereospinus]
MIKLPEADGTLTPYVPRDTAETFPADPAPFRTRSMLATAHVLGDPLADNEPLGPVGPTPPPQKLDWDATLAFRRHLWSHGFTLCEGMDTAHRGMGVDWPLAAELIRRCGAEARAVGGRMAAAVLTDQIEPFEPCTLKDVQAAYEEQLAVVEEAGAQPVIMCSPPPHRRRPRPRRLRRGVRRPDPSVGPAGDPALDHLRVGPPATPSTGATRSPSRPTTPCWTSSAPTRARSTASRSAPRTSTARSPGGPSCPRA